MKVSKYEVQFFHENKSYSLILYDSDVTAVKEEVGKRKITVKGRNYAIAVDPGLPKSVTELFESFRGKTFSSDKELLNKIELSSDKIESLSLTKKVFNVATERLHKKKYLESENAIQLRNTAFAQLKSCDPSDTENIEKIIRNSKCSPSVLFTIATQVDNELLADKIREIARPFNLKSEIKGMCEQISAHHFSKDLGKKYADYLENRFKEGAYNKILETQDLANVLTEDLVEFSRDPHFEVDPRINDSSTSESEVTKQEKELARLLSTNFGFGEVLGLNDVKACLLEIFKFENPKTSFEGHKLAEGKALSLIRQIKDLNPEVVIFDLRKNNGGSPYMVELFCNYFNGGKDEQVLCNFEYSQSIEESERDTFPTEACKLVSYDQLPERERILDKPIYILISHETMSAGEDFACHFKELNGSNTRVTLIGETTKGAANLNKLFDAGDHFKIAVPIGGAVVPYSSYNRNWEGVGITPHIPIQADDALERAKAHISEQRFS